VLPESVLVVVAVVSSSSPPPQAAVSRRTRAKTLPASRALLRASQREPLARVLPEYIMTPSSSVSRSWPQATP
jgi:hypothetical protein